MLSQANTPFTSRPWPKGELLFIQANGVSLSTT